MRPVDAKHKTSQPFGSGATQGVVANPDPRSGMGYYVWLYGNYQPFGHAGLDIAAPVGTPIYAPADGTVLYAGWSEDLPGTGNVRKWLLYYNFGGIITVIQHKGWISVIAHQSNNNHVKAGDTVREGQLIGLSGNTKTRTTFVAPHVHIEALVYMDYRTDVSKGIVYGRVDPTTYFGGGLAAQGEIKKEEGFLVALSDADQNEALAHLRDINNDTDALLQRTEPFAELIENVRKIVWQNVATQQGLAAIDAKTIASTIPADLAQAVVDELVARLKDGK